MHFPFGRLWRIVKVRQQGFSARPYCRVSFRQCEGLVRAENFPCHGIGLNPVESPRINPHWDDHFQVGDVFRLEPGLYSPDLRAGVRIENDYVLTESGIRALSDSASVVPR